MRLLIPVFSALLLLGCATPQNNYDPLESVNRPIYSLNKGIDTYALRPLADSWKQYVPDPLQQGVHNFFENISDIFAVPAAALQGKFGNAGNGLKRVFVNTTIGVGGLFNVADDLEIPKSDEDFGQVLGYWGVPTGPYLMLPVLGPKTVRDSVDTAIGFAAGPTAYMNSDALSYSYLGVKGIDARVQLLPLDKILAEQYDEYAFLRDTYLQHRWFKVHDGNPPHPLPMANGSNADDDEEDEDEDALPASEAPASDSKLQTKPASSGVGQP